MQRSALTAASPSSQSPSRGRPPCRQVERRALHRAEPHRRGARPRRRRWSARVRSSAPARPRRPRLRARRATAPAAPPARRTAAIGMTRSDRQSGVGRNRGARLEHDRAGRFVARARRAAPRSPPRLDATRPRRGSGARRGAQRGSARAGGQRARQSGQAPRRPARAKARGVVRVALDEAELRREAAALVPERDIARRAARRRVVRRRIGCDLRGDHREADPVAVADEAGARARGEVGDGRIVARRDDQIGRRRARRPRSARSPPGQ